jgi:phage-related protein
VVGAAIGGWIGTELTKIIKDQLDKVPFLQDAFAFIDVEFNKLLDSIKGLFSAVQTTFGQFTDMVDVLYRSLQRFYGDVIEPFFKSIADFYTGVWNKVVEGFTFVGNFLKDTFELTSIGQGFRPCTD